MNTENTIDKIFGDFYNLIFSEIKTKWVDYHKLYEENFRYLWYKSLLKNWYKNSDIIYEANFSKGKNDKVDMKFLDNFLEIKLNRKLENKNWAPRPYKLWKVFSDLYKLANAKDENKYFLYIYDTTFKEYIESKKLDWIIKEENKGKKKFNKKIYDLPKTFWDQIPKGQEKQTLNFSLINKKEIPIKKGNKQSLYICLYKIN